MGLPARITSGLPCSPGEGATPSPRTDTPNQGQPEQGLQLYVSTLTTTTALLPHQSPAEIKRREVSWTLKKRLDTFAGPGEIKRREVVLDPQVSPEDIKSREVELSCESWASFLLQVVTRSTAVQQTLSL